MEHKKEGVKCMNCGSSDIEFKSTGTIVGERSNKVTCNTCGCMATVQEFEVIL